MAVNWRERTAQDEFYFWTGVRCSQGQLEYGLRECKHSELVSSHVESDCRTVHSRYSKSVLMSVDSPLWSVYFTRDFKL